MTSRRNVANQRSNVIIIARKEGTGGARERIIINAPQAIIGERSEPHTYRTVGKNLRHIYIYVFYIYIYIYIYTSVRRARAVNARARYAQTSDRPAEVQWSI